MNANKPLRSFYDQKRLDPRWQRKVDEVRRLADYTCADCGAQHRNVQVHHKIYERDEHGNRKDPWDYPMENFKLLCDDCHEQTTIALQNIKLLCGEFTFWEINAFVDDFYTLMKAGIAPSATLNAIKLLMSQPDYIQAVVNDYEFQERNNQQCMSIK